MPILCYDYRLAPEFKQPTQLEDSIQAIKWIAKNGPQGEGPATKIYLAGDSSGGGLAMSLA
jgi:acetyl esterase